MTSMTRLRRQVYRWTQYAHRSPDPEWVPRGMERAWFRHDAERLRRNLLAAGRP